MNCKIVIKCQNFVYIEYNYICTQHRVDVQLSKLTFTIMIILVDDEQVAISFQ